MVNAIRLLLLCLLLARLEAFAAAPEDARSIVEAAALTGGVVVHVGVEDGAFTTALRQNDAIVVSGLVDTPDALVKARAYALSKGLSGPVSFAELTGKSLPYVDNSVNLLVATGPLPVDAREVTRVLCPGGAAVVSEAGNRDWLATVGEAKSPGPKGYVTFRKAVPPGLDAWTHFLHGPDGHTESAKHTENDILSQLVPP